MDLTDEEIAVIQQRRAIAQLGQDPDAPVDNFGPAHTPDLGGKPADDAPVDEPPHPQGTEKLDPASYGDLDDGDAPDLNWHPDDE